MFILGKAKIQFSEVYPLQINGLAEMKNVREKAAEICFDKFSTAVCGICNAEKRSKSDRAFR